MITHVHGHHVSLSSMCRSLARASAAMMFVLWLGFVITEVAVNGPPRAPNIAYHAVALSLVFGGYVLGWRKELLGGLLALLGTAAYFVANTIVLQQVPGIEAAWFAAPGVLYLLAWALDKAHWESKSHRFLRH